MMMRTGLVFVLLLCQCSHSSAQECRRKISENVYIQGENITDVFSPDAQHCQQMCTQHPECRFFTFVPADSNIDNRNYRCTLKNPSGNIIRIPFAGVTSGDSLKPCPQISAPCFDQVYNDTDFFGADYRFLFTVDYKECQRACTQDPGCQFFTWVNGNFADNPTIRNKCHLKFSVSVLTPTKVNKVNGVMSGFSSKAEICASSDCLKTCPSKYFPDIDIPGSDFLIIPSPSPEHCQILCSAHPLCTYFSFEGTTCFLKNNPNGMVTVAKQGVTSGLPSRFCQQDKSSLCSTLNNIDFVGDDLIDVKLNDVQSCRKACNDERDCLFYSYITDAFSDPSIRLRCFLKRSITIPAPPHVSRLANAISGFTLRNCKGFPAGRCPV